MTKQELKAKIDKLENGIKSKATPANLIAPLKAQKAKLEKELQDMEASEKKAVKTKKVSKVAEKIKAAKKSVAKKTPAKAPAKEERKKDNIARDGDRKSLPAGKRISKTGKVYYEMRANRTDKQTSKKPYLAKGGKLFIPYVGDIDDFLLKSLLQKNSVVKNILGTKEMEFLNDSNTDVIGVSGKNYDFIVTDGEKEFEFSIHKNGRVIKTLRPARPQIVEHYKTRYDSKMADGGELTEKYNVSFNYNPSNLKNEDAEKIVSYYTKDWRRNNDFDEVSFYVMRLNKSDADMLVKELKMEDAYNIEVDKSNYADGGETEEGVDLFEDYENIPSNVQEVLDKYSDAFEDGDYRKLEKANNELKKIGYTFEYGLDGEAYDLRKIGQKGKMDEDEYAKGGIVVTSIKDIPNFKERLEQGRITYRGLGLGKLYNDFYDIAGTGGTRIKVDGKEYFITDEEFNSFARGEDGKLRVRFAAPARRGYADGGETDWGADLGGGFSIGNDVYITDSKSLFQGKTGFVSGSVGRDLLVTILDNGNERSVVVSKKGVEKLDAPEYAKGGELKTAQLLIIDPSNPLSTQLKKLTGDFLNSADFKDIGSGNFNILTHKHSNKIFIVYPKRIYDSLPEQEKQDDINYLKNVEKIKLDSESMAHGGMVEIGSEGMYRGGAAKVLKYDDKTKMYTIKYLNEDGEPEGNFVFPRKDEFEYGFSNFNPKMAHGGYVIFEGRDNYNNKPLYKVISKDEDNDYDGEFHDNREDAEKELKELNKENMNYADGGKLKSKYVDGDMVYSYQNKDYAAPVNYVRFSPWKSDGSSDPKDTYKYRLTLKDGNSHWINEESLFKTKQEKYASGGYMASGGEVDSLKNALRNKIKECEDMVDELALHYKEDSKSMEALTDGLQMLGRARSKFIIYTNNEDLKKMASGGYMADGGMIYKMADNMTDSDYENKLSSLNEKQKKTYESLVRLGDSPKLALATTLLSNEAKWSDDTTRAYTMAKGGKVPAHFGSGKNIDVFGYQTENFDICGTAVKEFESAMEIMQNGKETYKESLARCAKYVDGLFGIEKLVVETSGADDANFYEAVSDIMSASIYNYRAEMSINLFSFVPQHLKEIAVRMEKAEKGGLYALGGMTAGRWYRDKSGEEFKFIGKIDSGENKGKFLFTDGQKSVYKDLEDFEGGRPKETKLFGFFEDGGSVAEGNYEMLMSNIKAIKHHAEELEGAVTPNTEIEAWVLSKSERAETDLSDITHYLDGLKMEKGGYMAKGGEIVTDAADVQKIKNSIQEGELILRAGKSYGRKLSAAELESVRKSVNNSRKKIGLGETQYASGGYMAEGGFFDTKGDVKFKFSENEKIKVLQYDGGRLKKLGATIIEQYAAEQPDGTYYPFYWVVGDWNNAGKQLYSEDELIGRHGNKPKKMADGGYMAKGGQVSGKFMFRPYKREGKFFVSTKLKNVDADSEMVKGVQGKLKGANADSAENVALEILKKHDDIDRVEIWKEGASVLKNKKVGQITRSEGYKLAFDREYFEDGGMMAKGGFVSKGELVWRKLTNAKKMEFLKENFTPEITPRSQETLVGKDYNFLPKNVKIKFEAKYANVEDYASGGKVKFADKVKSVQESLLKRKKVAPQVQKDYGKTYSKAEAKESAQRIVGSRMAQLKEKMAKKKK
jgi:hypothetical protein